MYKILKKKRLNSLVCLMEIEAPYVARSCQPGQFVIIRVDENGERIPLTIADYHRDRNSITIVYQELGYSTRKLSTKNEGDHISDCAGPLGVPAELDGKYKRVLGVAGGVGAAPLLPQLKKLASMGVETHVILGGRSDEFVILEEEFQGFAKVFVCTDDGSRGMKGNVVDGLKDLVSRYSYDKVIAIGPLPMMKAVVDYTKTINIPTHVSLNPIMIDGTGMCGGCRVTVGGETKFACVDGPDFDGFLVDFDEAMMRQTKYRNLESKCTEHHCVLKGGDNNAPQATQ
ncbi:sulfide/dihydroorotate dehydrogenase-like FAD/NAD-binding protein [Desulfofalx alkaliphila]|uniref:sulfide/dihydroorotate dehydrogenase-like FAD/NAD-binding protein n=1 Tax=Desulfofalx alkaliphila TaxID=105483 RepID=UPI0004E203B8|nr:sulfide/dihydroorotate dehydrogenase-like FAD/NAD-binding protein [Desulfofalx alkaliphila]